MTDKLTETEMVLLVDRGKCSPAIKDRIMANSESYSLKDSTRSYNVRAALIFTMNRIGLFERDAAHANVTATIVGLIGGLVGLMIGLLFGRLMS